MAPFLILMGETLVRSQQLAVTKDNDAFLLLEVQETATRGNTGIPTWSAYNLSIPSVVLPTTRVGTAPLIAAPAHEWSTLLTVLMQSQGINSKVMGSDHRTVISLDFGLYKPTN